MKPFFLNYH